LNFLDRRDQTPNCSEFTTILEYVSWIRNDCLFWEKFHWIQRGSPISREMSHREQILQSWNPRFRSQPNMFLFVSQIIIFFRQKIGMLPLLSPIWMRMQGETKARRLFRMIFSEIWMKTRKRGNDTVCDRHKSGRVYQIHEISKRRSRWPDSLRKEFFAV
jgi:hypothetical protein